jgi:dihydroflavonol-4-reductase
VAFVTGATGFLGRALVPRLGAAGYSVHALARRGSDRAAVGDAPVRWHLGTVEDAPAVRRALRAAAGVGRPSLVVHAAACISYRRTDGPLQERVNVGGTRHVLEAAREAGFERCVHVGSVVALDVAPDARAVLDEEVPPTTRLERVDYVRTKRRADELALGLGAVVVDPGAIFGPGRAGSNTTRFVDRVRTSGAPPLVPPGGLAVVDVDDVAEGVLAAADRGRGGRRYLLVESNRTLFELFTLAAEIAGRRAPVGTVPRPLWRAVVAGARAVDRLRPLQLLAPDGLRLLGEHYRFDAARARTELRWRPRPFRDTLERTIAWLDGRG